jgi:nickel-dependent lactate racemase
MKVPLAYGRGRLEAELPDGRTTVLEPRHAPPLADERAAVLAALRAPVGRPPLRDVVRGARSVVIAFTDATRATPNERLIPWILGELTEVPREGIVLLNQLGTHRPVRGRSSNGSSGRRSCATSASRTTTPATRRRSRSSGRRATGPPRS